MVDNHWRRPELALIKSHNPREDCVSPFFNAVTDIAPNRSMIGQRHTTAPKGIDTNKAVLFFQLRGRIQAGRNNLDPIV